MRFASRTPRIVDFAVDRSEGLPSALLTYGNLGALVALDLVFYPKNRPNDRYIRPFDFSDFLQFEQLVRQSSDHSAFAKT